ncbi:hypothetical protein H696_03215 [Fonticula alba]|uniref:RGS domain-containing protein n=1 Tax=Fonticula alba TaxID=691883 RepID=A0A058ZBQ3_FONAL|nr:hypothetical protein H696_03215 [Fonticula alba]KCV70857.1 hypothetical protein H696_03215 [Fonticula alba]|eukprot:XP_009495373.1 hypothetical protein H696_03215 [Fonticula alba]
MVVFLFVDYMAAVTVPIQLLFFGLYFLRFQQEPITPRGRFLTSVTFIFILIHHIVLLVTLYDPRRLIVSCWGVLITSGLYPLFWGLPYVLRALVVYYRHMHNKHAMCMSRLSMLRDSSSASQLHEDTLLLPASPAAGGREMPQEGSRFWSLLMPWRTSGRSGEAKASDALPEGSHPLEPLTSKVDPAPGAAGACASAGLPEGTASSTSMEPVSPGGSLCQSKHKTSALSLTMDAPSPTSEQPGEVVDVYQLKQKLAQELNKAITFRKTRSFALLKWVQSSRNQVIIFLGTSLVSLIFVVMAMILTIDTPFDNYTNANPSCIYGSKYVIMLEVIVLIPIVAIPVTMVWSARDIYLMKQELYINTSASFLVALLWGISAAIGDMGWFRPEIIAIFLTTFNNLLIVIFPVTLSFLPFYRNLTHQRNWNPLFMRESQSAEEPRSAVNGILDFETFRHFPGPAMQFEQFCVESWCAEIHLFQTRCLRYLDNYDRMSPMQRYREVLEMRDQFVRIESPFEINIPGNMRQKLLRTFDEVAVLDQDGQPGPIPRDIFLPAQQETSEQLNRLLHIWRDTPAGKRETQELLVL